MSQYSLYYAGMAGDRQTEQIGLACSDDGIRFTRWGDTGLIIPIDPALSWKRLRTCNPTVIRAGSTWTMFYQGVGHDGSGNVEHAIARAVSGDGRTWVCDSQPCLTFAQLRDTVAGWDSVPGGGVIEPTVVVRDGRYEMIFVAYQGKYSKGTWLFDAVSADGIEWQVSPAPIVQPADFPGVRLHYPQLVEWESRLWFSLVGLTNSAAAICSARLDRSGLTDVTQHLPATSGGIRVQPRQALPLLVADSSIRGAARLNQWANRLLHGGRNYWGFAHSHLLGPGSAGRMYYHAYHRNSRSELWMDVGSCVLHGDGDRHHAVGLTPAADPHAWDSFFVADPFVVGAE